MGENPESIAQRGVTNALSELSPLATVREHGTREVARKVTEIKIELLPFFTVIAIIGGVNETCQYNFRSSSP